MSKELRVEIMEAARRAYQAKVKEQESSGETYGRTTLRAIYPFWRLIEVLEEQESKATNQSCYRSTARRTGADMRFAEGPDLIQTIDG